MSSVVEQWKAQLVTLTAGERAEPAHFLLTSLEPGDDGVEAAWDDEAARRVREIHSGREAGRPVDEFLAELRERFP